MKNLKTSPILIILALLVSPPSRGEVMQNPPQGPSITLKECFERAKKINETVGISAENTRLIQAQYRSKVGYVLPHLNWLRDQFYQDKGGSPGAGSPLQVQPLSYFELNQPIFGGFRDWRAVDIVKSQKTQSELAERATDLQLLSDVAEAFYAAYTVQDSLAVLQETRKLNQEQVDQLNKWVNIGRSRPSEVLSAQTQLATLDAQIVDLQRTYTDARHMLLFLAGVEPDVRLIDDHPVAVSTPLNDALTKASNRPDVLSSAENLRQAELWVRYYKGAHYPTVSAVGRYYTERVGFLADVDWDINLKLDVPIYQGGSTQADVRAARSQEIISRLTHARLKRDVERQVRTAYDNLSQSAVEEQAYDKAVKLVQDNYDTQKKEYRLGIISNLELLRLLTDMQQVRRQWLFSRANARLDDIRLRIAMGEGL